MVNEKNLKIKNCIFFCFRQNISNNSNIWLRPTSKWNIRIVFASKGPRKCQKAPKRIAETSSNGEKLIQLCLGIPGVRVLLRILRMTITDNKPINMCIRMCVLQTDWPRVVWTTLKKLQQPVTEKCFNCSQRLFFVFAFACFEYSFCVFFFVFSFSDLVFVLVVACLSICLLRIRTMCQPRGLCVCDSPT